MLRFVFILWSKGISVLHTISSNKNHGSNLHAYGSNLIILITSENPTPHVCAKVSSATPLLNLSLLRLRGHFGLDGAPKSWTDREERRTSATGRIETDKKGRTDDRDDRRPDFWGGSRFILLQWFHRLTFRGCLGSTRGCLGSTRYEQMSAGEPPGFHLSIDAFSRWPPPNHIIESFQYIGQNYPLVPWVLKVTF